MNIDLVVNARGKVCLIHDAPFAGTPLWVRYHTDMRRIEVLFDNGTSDTIEHPVPDDVHPYLMRINKILIIRIDGDEPVEGYDTAFIRKDESDLETHATA
ncbi:MAG: hypothetical protein IPI58_07100 [Alphaproteobacteria bacterium]|nr:MAG: hypothetical protein IPI58_07100 [Alphaproteobacteria bacterium]